MSEGLATVFRSKKLMAARAIAERRDFTNSEVIAIRHMARDGANLREVFARFPLDVTLQTYRQKLLRLGIHARRATSDIRCGDNVTMGAHGRFHDAADMRPFRPRRA